MQEFLKKYDQLEDKDRGKQRDLLEVEIMLDQMIREARKESIEIEEIMRKREAEARKEEREKMELEGKSKHWKNNQTYWNWVLMIGLATVIIKLFWG